MTALHQPTPNFGFKKLFWTKPQYRCECSSLFTLHLTLVKVKRMFSCEDLIYCCCPLTFCLSESDACACVCVCRCTMLSTGL